MRTVAFLLPALVLAIGCSEVEIDPPDGGGGSGGTGGEGGSGGAYQPFPESCTPSDLTGVCDQEAKLCGNGAVDTCEVCFSTNGEPPQCEDATEACDTEAAKSCEELGYAGGGRTLCTSACTHDVRDCDSCLGSANQLGCARPRVDGFDVLDLQLATDGDIVAAAWISFDKTLHFARFSTALQLIDQRAGCATVEGGGMMSLAPTPGGWVLAVGGVGDNPQTRIYSLDAAGNELGAPRIVGDAAFPVLVPRPAATPYLVYTSTTFAGGTGEVIAELLDAEGGAAWQAALPGDAFPELTVAGFADPGLLVAARTTDGTTSTTLLVPVDEAGGVGATREIPDAVEIAVANAGTDRLAAVWRKGESQELQWLDGNGEDIGSPVMLAPKEATTATQERTIVVSGGRAIVMLAEDTRKKLSMFHVEPDGSFGVEPYTLAIEPGEVAWLAGTEGAGDPVFAWTTFAADPGTSRFVLGSVRR
jgi:hypothetical protein